MLLNYLNYYYINYVILLILLNDKLKIIIFFEYIITFRLTFGFLKYSPGNFRLFSTIISIKSLVTCALSFSTFQN